jgi:DNA-binding response OmpR family regulator
MRDHVNSGPARHDVAMVETAVVVVEDDPNIADLVDMYLRREGYRVFLCPDGESALKTIADRAPRVVVLDVGLPGEIDGLELCRRLRTDGRDVGIIMLTARDGEVDRVLGLELGADDYVTKPFSPRELVARVKALLRRSDGSRTTHPAVHTAGRVEVDIGRREARLGGTPVPLATREFDLLAHLFEHRGLALSRRQLLDGVWGDGWIGDERTVDVHVRQLRRKLGDDLPLATVWGVGYRLD